MRNFQLPPELNEQLVSEINEVPDDIVLEWGRTFIAGGFTKARAIRERLATGLRSNAAVEPWLMDLFRGSLRGRLAIEALTIDTIRRLVPSLLALLGGRSLALALLADARDEVHKMGIETLPKALAPMTEQEQIDAKLEWHLFLDDLYFSHLPPPTPGDLPAEGDEEGWEFEPAAPAAAPVAESELQKTVKEQQEQIAKLERFLEDEKRRHKADVKQATQTAEETKANFTARLEQAQAATKSAQQEQEALRTKLDRLSAEMAQGIARGVEEQTSALVRKWLHEPARLQRAAESPQGDLLARAEQALQLQASQDRVAGNRLELERKLDDLSRARDRLLRAEETAMRPLASVTNARQEIEAEIDRIRGVLESGRPEAELARKFLAQINASGDRSELRGFSQLVQDLARLNLLGAPDRRKLYDGLQRKFSLLDERDKVTDGRTGDSGWSLRNAIYRNFDTIIMFDGHNILFGLEDIFAPDYEEGVPKQRARQRLVRMVQCLVESRPKVNALICFDGPSGSLQNVAPNLRVEFSGGNGEHRADQLIIANLQGKTAPNRKVFVVSDDLAVQREATKNQAIPVPIDLWAVLLADFKCLS